MIHRRKSRPTVTPERILAIALLISLSENVIERILRHLGLWQEGVRVHCGTDPPGETTPDPWLDDPSPTTTPNRSWRSPPPETPGSA
jgi:hypothetical protein